MKKILLTITILMLMVSVGYCQDDTEEMVEVKAKLVGFKSKKYPMHTESLLGTSRGYELGFRIVEPNEYLNQKKEISFTSGMWDFDYVSGLEHHINSFFSFKVPLSFLKSLRQQIDSDKVLDLTEEKNMSSTTEKDLVPDEATAIMFAEAIWLPMFGEHIYTYKPFHAFIREGTDDMWVVSGTMPKSTDKNTFILGGTPVAYISKKDGRVIKVFHEE